VRILLGELRDRHSRIATSQRQSPGIARLDELLGCVGRLRFRRVVKAEHARIGLRSEIHDSRVPARKADFADGFDPRIQHDFEVRVGLLRVLRVVDVAKQILLQLLEAGVAQCTHHVRV